jgi:hypothetical protein
MEILIHLGGFFVYYGFAYDNTYWMLLAVRFTYQRENSY